jgi:hypothetical protein
VNEKSGSSITEKENVKEDSENKVWVAVGIILLGQRTFFPSEMVLYGHIWL